MKGFVADIEELTDDNSDYRRVLYTGSHLQLVLMSLAPDEEIGEEVHKSGDQFFRVEKGKGEVWIDGSERRSKPTTPSSFQQVRAIMSSIRAASA